jgi:hypothetical protein
MRTIGAIGIKRPFGKTLRFCGDFILVHQQRELFSHNASLATRIVCVKIGSQDQETYRKIRRPIARSGDLSQDQETS